MTCMLTKTVLLMCIGGFAMSGAYADDDLRVVNEGSVGQYWKAAEGARFAGPGYPESQASHPDQVCLALGYKVNANGSTSDFAILNRHSSADAARANATYWEAFEQSAAAAVAQWRFVPRDPRKPVPLYTVTTMRFGNQAGSLQASCAVTDLAAALADGRKRRYNKSAGKHEVDVARERLQAESLKSAASQFTGRN